MVQLSAIICSCITILWVILASFAAITLCVASRRMLIFVVYYVIDSVRKLSDTPSYKWVTPHIYHPLCFPTDKRILKNWNNNIFTFWWPAFQVHKSKLLIILKKWSPKNLGSLLTCFHVVPTRMGPLIFRGISSKGKFTGSKVLWFGKGCKMSLCSYNNVFSVTASNIRMNMNDDLDKDLKGSNWDLF
jgi:hypothetical protein